MRVERHIKKLAVTALSCQLAIRLSKIKGNMDGHSFCQCRGEHDVPELASSRYRVIRKVCSNKSCSLNGWTAVSCENKKRRRDEKDERLT